MRHPHRITEENHGAPAFDFPTAMDAVPVCFIKEVVLLLERGTSYIRGPQEVAKLSSLWGRISNLAVLKVYLSSNGQAVFTVDLDDRPLVWKLEDFKLEQRVFRRIELWNDEGHALFHMDCHPFTEETFKLLRSSHWRDYPCEIAIRYTEENYQPLVDQLCLMPSRVTTLRICSDVRLPMQLLTRIMTSGNLRTFYCHSRLHLPAELLPLLLKFIASKELNHFTAVLERNSPVPCEILITETIDAFLSRERTKPFRFCVGERYEHLCGRLKGKEKVVFSVASNDYFVRVAV
uniref:F-box domain-containing protein n=1 Tax=Steinernema glaseri TaxID=37863 RepID=A0A1I7ZFG2_9BILA